jgi:spore coat polysaccharide biosynthesis predicted glycosyltransferase SpsG
MSLQHRYCKSFATVNEIENDLQKQAAAPGKTRVRAGPLSKGLTPVNAV